MTLLSITCSLPGETRHPRPIGQTLQRISQNLQVDFSSLPRLSTASFIPCLENLRTIDISIQISRNEIVSCSAKHFLKIFSRLTNADSPHRLRYFVCYTQLFHLSVLQVRDYLQIVHFGPRTNEFVVLRCTGAKTAVIMKAFSLFEMCGTDLVRTLRRNGITVLGEYIINDGGNSPASIH